MSIRGDANRSAETPLMVFLIALGITNQFVILLVLRRRPDHFAYIETGRLQFKNEFVQGDPGFRVHLRVVDLYSQFQVIAVRAVEALLDAEFVAMRTACAI